MAFVEWRWQGIQISHCNCNIGCPCQFNALPSNGNCRAYMFGQIDKGNFGKTKLDGLRFGGLFAWPGPIHMGNGEAMPVIDERADKDQRAAIEAVLMGKETDPGSLITQVFSTTLVKAHPTQYKPIDLKIDEKTGTASVKIPGILDAKAEPIKNPMTGAAHRAKVVLPTGFEYEEAEFVTGTGKSQGPIKLDFNATHAHIAKLHWSTHGVVR
jgi:hypothetical protein